MVGVLQFYNLLHFEQNLIFTSMSYTDGAGTPAPMGLYVLRCDHGPDF